MLYIISSYCSQLTPGRDLLLLIFSQLRLRAIEAVDAMLESDESKTDEDIESSSSLFRHTNSQSTGS